MFKRIIAQTILRLKKHLTVSTQYSVQPLTYLKQLYCSNSLWYSRQMLIPSHTSLEILKKCKEITENSAVFHFTTVHTFFPILIVIIVLVAILVGMSGSGGLDCAKIKSPSFGIFSEFGSPTFERGT